MREFFSWGIRRIRIPKKSFENPDSRMLEVKNCWNPYFYGIGRANTHVKARTNTVRKSQELDFKINIFPTPGHSVVQAYPILPSKARLSVYAFMFHSPQIGRLTRPSVRAGFKDNSTIIPARLDKGNAFCMIIAPFGRYWDI